MSSFYQLFSGRRSSVSENEIKFDVISNLPIEISTMIFRMLDPASMLAAMQVRKRWYTLYKCDMKLRRALREKLRRQRVQKKLFIHNFTVSTNSKWYKKRENDVCGKNMRNRKYNIKRKCDETLPQETNSKKRRGLRM
ncbi:hypothetical protein PGB90_002407 [Kerria lacca]